MVVHTGASSNEIVKDNKKKTSKKRVKSITGKKKSGKQDNELMQACGQYVCELVNSPDFSHQKSTRTCPELVNMLLRANIARKIEKNSVHCNSFQIIFF